MKKELLKNVNNKLRKKKVTTKYLFFILIHFYILLIANFTQNVYKTLILRKLRF